MTFDQASDMQYVAEDEATATILFHEEYESEDGLDIRRIKPKADKDDKSHLDIETTQTIDNNIMKDVYDYNNEDDEDSNETRGKQGE